MSRPPASGRLARVLVIDSSVMGRHLAVRALDGHPWFEVIAATGPTSAALTRVRAGLPDVVTIDVGESRPTFVALVHEVRRLRPEATVVALCRADRVDDQVELDALAAGASALVPVPVPRNDLEASVEALREVLVPRLLGLVRPVTAASAVPVAAALGRPRGGEAAPPVEVVVIGSSTGGPDALRVLWSRLPGDLAVPVLIVQHMPASFTALFADQLSSAGQVPCREAVDGQVLRPGEAIVAAGDRHLFVRGGAHGPVVAVSDGPRVHGCRPSVDHLFASAAATFGAGVLGVVLTGMGSDGCDGSRAIAEAGGAVYVQDQASSVVWGMPGSVAAAGLADAILPIADLAPAIAMACAAGRSRAVLAARAMHAGDPGAGGAR